MLLHLPYWHTDEFLLYPLRISVFLQQAAQDNFQFLLYWRRAAHLMFADSSVPVHAKGRKRLLYLWLVFLLPAVATHLPAVD